MIADHAITNENQENFESYRYAKQHGVLITAIQTDYATGVYRSDCSPSAIIELKLHIKLPFHLQKISEEEFAVQLAKKYGTKTLDILQYTENATSGNNLQQMIDTLPITSDIMDTESNSPIIRLINVILQEAIKQSASDIHFEPFADKLIIRIRVDGILHNILEVPPYLANLIISRIKVIANLNIAEKRLPQDGRVSIIISGRTIDARISTIPVNYGERIVLRILDRQSINLDLNKLGMNDQLLNTVRNLIKKTHGIILVTGPTGSGKTTTLYAMLSELNIPGRNIMTVEDPIEFDLAGIAQTHVDTKIDMTFAKSLRAILRQDPNIIMTGEIRDLETAIIAIQASLTGHLVLSTLHTNSAASTIMRLIDMGIQNFLLSSSLIGVIAQRLIRLLCKHCKEPYTANADECNILGLNPNDSHTIYKAKGCDRCNQKGYHHRLGIYEIIEVDDAFKEMIHKNASQAELESYIHGKSPSLFKNGCSRILSGETSVEEIMRIFNE